MNMDLQKRACSFLKVWCLPYINADAFGELLKWGAENDGAGNEVVFDYLPPSVIDGSCEREEGRNIYSEVNSHGEGFQIGIRKRGVGSASLCQGISPPREHQCSGPQTALFLRGQRPAADYTGFLVRPCGAWLSGSHRPKLNIDAVKGARLNWRSTPYAMINGREIPKRSPS